MLMTSCCYVVKGFRLKISRVWYCFFQTVKNAELLCHFDF